MAASVQREFLKHIFIDLTKVYSKLRSQSYFQNAQLEEALFNAWGRNLNCVKRPKNFQAKVDGALYFQ